MPRKYYRRKYSYRPKKKWASNFYTISDEIPIPGLPAGQQFSESWYVKEIVHNPQYNPASASVGILKVKNVKLQLAGIGILDHSDRLNLSMQVAIVFLPEGVTADAGLLFRHPEWIMAYKMISVDTDMDKPISFSISSRLARNLNSGDRIGIAYFARLNTNLAAAPAQNIGATVMPVYVSVQYWTSVN